MQEEALLNNLRERATQIRMDIIQMLEAAGSGHAAGPLGMADIYAALYFEILTHDPKRPDWPERDRLIVSCGHTCPVRYAAMAEAGYFPREDLVTLRHFGSALQGHPSRVDLPGLETSSGPLGQGLSQAVGMALAARLQGASWRTFCVMSDGEQQEGQIWEAVMLGGARKLSNLTAILDRNHIQISGTTEDVLGPDPLAAKYESFGWEVLSMNGNDLTEILAALRKPAGDAPRCIIAETVPGKGVSFMENDYRWHGKVPDITQAKTALAELRRAQ